MALTTNVAGNLDWIFSRKIATKSAVAEAAKTSRAQIDRVLQNASCLDTAQIDAIAVLLSLPAETLSGPHSTFVETCEAIFEKSTISA